MNNKHAKAFAESIVDVVNEEYANALYDAGKRASTNVLDIIDSLLDSYYEQIGEANAEAAKQYVSADIGVIPAQIACKNPFENYWFLKVARSTERVAELWNLYPAANVAIVPENGIICLSINYDEYDGSDGYASLRNWEQIHGPIPATLAIRTGRLGEHRIFRVPNKYGCCKNILDYVDIISDGGYVIAPPSIHANGNQYVWLTPDGQIDLDLIAEANDSLLELIRIALIK